MLTKQAIFVLSLLAMVMAEDSDVTKFMKHLEVIPDVIPEGPQDFLKISYDSGVFADKGVELTPTQVQNEPKVEWTSADDSSYYTLIMTDPDAPSRQSPKFREWHHWLVVNIPGNDLSQGEVLSPYLGSGPPLDSGLHRYVFLLYKQPKKLDFNEKHLTNTDMEGRALFSTQKFAKKYELGVPVAGNFFQAQWDAYVPKLYKKLGA